MSVDLEFVKDKIAEYIKSELTSNSSDAFKNGFVQALDGINEEILEYEKNKHIQKYKIGSIVFLIHQKMQEPFMVLNYFNNSGEFIYEIRSGINALTVCEFEIYNKERDKL
jgi:hypothetical protein